LGADITFCTAPDFRLLKLFDIGDVKILGKQDIFPIIQAIDYNHLFGEWSAAETSGKNGYSLIEYCLHNVNYFI